MSRATELFKARGMFPACMGNAELALIEELLIELETQQDERAELLRRAQAMGAELADYRRRCVDMKLEIEELSRIRHVARSYRHAEIDCMSFFGPEPRMRSWHRRLELDRLLGIAEELQGLA